jgi:ion channel POLLUX/CASTOR
MKRLKYLFDNLVTRGTGALMAVLVIATLTFVFIMGSIAFSLYDEYDYLLTLWYTLNHVIDPGYLFGNEGAEPAGFLLIMTLATFWGILVYSLIISFVSSSFLDKLTELRSGRGAVVEKDHTVILDYNDTVPIMMQELIESHLSQKPQVVVILAQRDPSEVLREIYAIVPRTKHTKVLVRQGLATRQEDLELVAIGQAKSVIIASDNDIQTIKVILALKHSTFYDSTNPYHAVCTIKEYNNLQVVNEIGDNKIEVIFMAQMKSKVFARSCLHPGLSSVYKNIFSFIGEEIYFDFKEEFVGKSFDTIVQTIEGASVIGIWRDGTSMINPDNNIIFQAGDHIIYISNDNHNISLSDVSRTDYSKDFKVDKYVNTSRNILTVGYNRSVAFVLKDMELYVGPESKLTMLVPNEHNKERLLAKYPNPKFASFEVIVGNTFELSLLKQFDLKKYDTIAIFANKDVTEENADAETLLTLLHLDNLRKQQKANPSIVLEIEDSVNAEALKYIRVDDFLISNLLVSKIMTQIAQNRYLNTVIHELVSEEGNEFYLKRANAYVSVNKEYPFYALVQAGQLRDHIVVGYKKFGEEVVLNPPKDTVLSFTNKDRLVVVARS